MDALRALRLPSSGSRHALDGANIDVKSPARASSGICHLPPIFTAPGYLPLFIPPRIFWSEPRDCALFPRTTANSAVVSAKRHGQSARSCSIICRFICRPTPSTKNQKGRDHPYPACVMAGRSRSYARAGTRKIIDSMNEKKHNPHT